MNNSKPNLLPSDTPSATASEFSRIQLLNSVTLWLAVITAGYAYVSLVLCQRNQPFESGNNSITDFIVLILMCLALFFAGPKESFKIETRFSRRSMIIGLACFLIPFFAALHW